MIKDEEAEQAERNILDSEGKANFESAEDNLQDLATYAIMMLEYIKKGGNK